MTTDLTKETKAELNALLATPLTASQLKKKSHADLIAMFDAMPASDARDVDLRDARDADLRDARDADLRDARDADLRDARADDLRDALDADLRDARADDTPPLP